MGSKSIIQSFSYSQEDLKIMQEIEKIAKREKRSLSYVLVEAAKEYAKAHGEGNDSYPLEQFEKGLLAYPTAWSLFGSNRLKTLTDEEILDMTEKLLARINEMNDEIRRRYPTLNGYREFKKFVTKEGVSTGKGR